MTPTVSISCITYNHAPYLRDAVESFLMQRDVTFEILIHDDCSTDGTVDIIKEYAQKFPHIVKPLFEEENQYSQGVSNISGVFNFPRAAGRYIAMCEGDDFWNDPYKLKKQSEYMDQHPECTLLTHSANIISEDGAYRSDDLIRPFDSYRELTTEEVISKPVNFPMASLMFPAELAKRLPEWYFDCPVGDIPLELFMAINGTVFYMDSPMSTYRAGRAGSWQNAMDDSGNTADESGVDAAGKAGAFRNKWEAHYAEMEKLYDAFNAETDGRYEAACADALKRSRFHIDIKEGKLSCVKDECSRKYLMELSKMERRLLKLKASAPGVYDVIKNAYRRFS